MEWCYPSFGGVLGWDVYYSRVCSKFTFYIRFAEVSRDYIMGKRSDGILDQGEIKCGSPARRGIFLSFFLLFGLCCGVVLDCIAGLGLAR